MTLPSSEILVKWSLHEVLLWLEREGLSDFKDGFRKDGIDGSRFCKLHESDVDKYICSNRKKKQLLKNHIANIDRSKLSSMPRYSDMWKNQQNQPNRNDKHVEQKPPALPPTRRAPPPVPVEPPSVLSTPAPERPPPDGEDNEDVYDWGDDFSSGSDSDSDTLSDYENSPDRQNGSNYDGGQDEYEMAQPENSHNQQNDNMVFNLLNALQKHRDSKRSTATVPAPTSTRHPAPARPVQDDEDDGEDYVEPLPQVKTPTKPPPRPRRRSVPTPPDSDVPQSLAPPIPSPGRGPPLPPSHKKPDPPLPQKKSELLPPPPQDVYDLPVQESKPLSRQLPPVPATRDNIRSKDTKQTTSEIKQPPPPRKPSNPKIVSVPPPRKNSQIKEPPQVPTDDYEEMMPVKQKKEKPVRTQEEHSDSLLIYPWYHSTVDRSKAEELLKAKNTDGMYLIRKSTRAGTDQKYTLMIYNQQKVYNLPVRSPQNNKYVLGKHKQDEMQFDSVPDLINYFSNMTIQLNPQDRSRTGRTKLITPLRKN